MSRFISLIALIAVIVVIGVLFYRVMIGFFVPVFLAGMLVVLFRPLHQWVLKKVGNRAAIAAGVTTVLILLSVLLPMSLVVSAAALQGLGWVRQAETSGETSVTVTLDKLRTRLGLQMEYKKQLEAIDTKLTAIKKRETELAASPGITSDQTMFVLGQQLSRLLRELQTEYQQKNGPILDEKFDQAVELTEKIGTADDESSGFAGAVLNLVSRVQQLRLDVLGGFPNGTLKELANPTDSVVRSTTNQAIEFVRPRLLSLTTATFGFLIELVISTAILIICVYFFLYEGPEMFQSVMALSPLDDRYEQELLLEFDRVTRAVVLATVLSALTQGAAAGIGYYVVGLPNLILLIMLTTVFAMVPFVGPAIVWVPCCIYLAFIEERLGAAIGLAAWGVLVVGTVDNFVKAGVLHGQSQLHPLLALLSVLGGVQAMGPIGIVVGPMAVVLLQTSLSILQRELSHFEDHGLVLTTRESSGPARKGRFKLRRKKKRDDGSGSKSVSESPSVDGSNEKPAGAEDNASPPEARPDQLGESSV
ncbi:MAG: AI-2E family transporter [Pirellulales bacterium]